MKIRSVKEQYEQRNICLRERLEQILPQVMRESEADPVAARLERVP